MNKYATVRMGALVGLIVGYPLSYFFQPDLLRAMVSLGTYMLHIGEVFKSGIFAGTAISVWGGSIVVFGLMGLYSAGKGAAEGQTIQRRKRMLFLRLMFVCMVVVVIGEANLPGKPGDPHAESWKAGDIVFLNGTSLRSKVVRLLEGYSCDYSHVGIIVVDDGVPFVVNADPSQNKVVKQRWDSLIARGQISGGAIFRLRNADASTLKTACAMAEEYAQKKVPFDFDFNLKNTDRLYCTDLVWRAYESAGVDLCRNTAMENSYILPADLMKSAAIQEVLRF